MINIIIYAIIIKKKKKREREAFANSIFLICFSVGMIYRIKTIDNMGNRVRNRVSIFKYAQTSKLQIQKIENNRSSGLYNLNQCSN
jgi:hypothetical protein